MVVIISITDFEKMFCVYDGEHNFEIDVEYFDGLENPDLKMSKKSAKELAFKIAKVCAEHCDLSEIEFMEDD